MKIQINARNRAHHFEVADSAKILYAGLANAIELPYECGSGTCGTCKAKLIEGEIHNAWSAAPGHKYLKAPAEFLMCQCEPKSDLVVEVGGFVQSMDAGACVPARVSSRIKSLRLLTEDVMLLEVGLDQPMDFDAGQFAMVRVPGVDGFRGWSMVNYQRASKTLQFVVKRKPGGGLSDWLFSSAKIEGVEIELFGPLGHATFYPSIAKNLLCIAGGSGIAGMMSILARAAEEGYFTQHNGDVFFGVRRMRDAFFLHEFAALRERCGARLRLTIALSDEDVPAEAARAHPALSFERGMVHEVAGRGMQGRYANLRAYVAGPPAAVDATLRVLLLEGKLTADNIRYDKFS